MGARVWAQIIDHQQVGPGVYGLSLEAPDIAGQARPGQFVMLRVGHGQDPLLARPFSIHGVAGDELRLLYKVVGRGTKLLSLVRSGKKLLVWGPLGSGFDLSADRPLLVAGGMGAAPLAFVAQELERAKKVCVYLSAGAGKSELLPLEQRLAAGLRWGTASGPLEKLAGFVEPKLKKPGSGDTPDVLLLSATDDGSHGLRGLATDLMERALAGLPIKFDTVLSCGPLPMLRAVAALCQRHGLACQVSLEAPMACGVGACLGCVLPAAGGGYLRVCQEGPVLDATRVDWERVQA